MVRQHVSLRQKLLISLFSAILFIIISLPIVYHFTNGILQSLNIQVLQSDGQPTLTGIAVHGVVFGLIVLLSMYM